VKRRARRALSSFAALAVGALLSASACAPLPPPRAFAGKIEPFHEGGRFAVVGDLQRTSWLEFWRESNDVEREVLARAIAAERPALLAITGDLVFDGSSAARWAELDATCAPIRDAGIPAFAALGNHEYWGGKSGPEHFFDRFPHLEKKHFYAIAYGPVRLVFLDSNIEEMPSAEWEKQRVWYEKTLADLDADPGVRGVLVLAHHPPYTNSTVTSDERYMQQVIVPPLLRAKKTLGLLSGHVHSYERFVREGKMFVVSGGGGGPRARLAEGKDRCHPDDLFAGPPIRDFHFTVFTVTAAGVAGEVMGLPKGGTTVAPMDRFELPWAL
jgi:calcineurin-like phosphoesterase family protein